MNGQLEGSFVVREYYSPIAVLHVVCIEQST